MGSWVRSGGAWSVSVLAVSDRVKGGGSRGSGF